MTDRGIEIAILQLLEIVHNDIHQLKGMLMSLAPEVQTLIDTVNASNAAIADVVAEITKVEGQVADLGKQVTDLQAQIAAGTPIAAEDLAAIVQATASLASGMASLKSALPAPAPAPAPAAGAPASS